MHTPPDLTALEAAAGFPLGGQARPLPPAARPATDPFDALSTVIEGTLSSGPPAVAFSGGRDSSLLLAVAAGVCRRAGLEPPVPVTLSLPDSMPEADERGWQERVLDHLGIQEWRKVQIDDELDLIGPYARRHLLREGLLFPANAHSVIPLLEASDGRCLVVGLGGDELLTPQQWHSVHSLLGRRRRPNRGDAIRLPACAIPRPVRGLTRRSRGFELGELRWLSALAKAQLDHAIRKRFEEPVLWGTAIRHLAARRDVVLPLFSMQHLAREGGHSVVAPFLDARFVSALARAGGASGWGTRSAAMDGLAHDLLPRDVIRRDDKAGFNRVFFGPYSREFAARWSGVGLDRRLVDPDALRREWLSDFPDFRTALLLQAAWLAERASELRVAA